MVPIVDLDRDALRDAKELSFEQKFMAGAELFDYAVTIALGGIRATHPEYDDEQAMAEVEHRIERGRRCRERS